MYIDIDVYALQHNRLSFEELDNDPKAENNIERLACKAARTGRQLLWRLLPFYSIRICPVSGGSKVYISTASSIYKSDSVNIYSRLTSAGQYTWAFWHSVTMGRVYFPCSRCITARAWNCKRWKDVTRQDMPPSDGSQRWRKKKTDSAVRRTKRRHDMSMIQNREMAHPGYLVYLSPNLLIHQKREKVVRYHNIKNHDKNINVGSWQ